MLTTEPEHGADLGDVGRARQVYAATRDIWIGGGGWLEPHERLGLLTVAAELRPFSLLNHLDKKDWDTTIGVLSDFGLTCAPGIADFDYEVDVTGAESAVEAYMEHERKYPLEGLGVWGAPDGCATGGLSGLSSLLCYPECCGAMDNRCKAHDHSAALQQLIDDADGDPEEIRRLLASGRGVLAWTEERDEWNKRLDRTRAMFPYALHTACDECLDEGDKSATGTINLLYRRLTLAVSAELDLMIRWACEVARLSATTSGPA